MTTDTSAPDARGSSSASGTPPRRRDWRDRLQWFAAEFLVVAAGVLVALALNAWWGARQDAAQERAYLHQLAADLRATEEAVAQADSFARPYDRAGTQLIRAFFAAERPPRDSLLTWFLSAANYVNPPQPVLGTATALIETGDLNLLRDDSLRSAITAYVEASRHLADEQERFTTYFLDGATLAFQYLTIWEVIAETTPEAMLDSIATTRPAFGLPPSPRRRPFPIDFDAILSDREALYAVERMAIGKRNLTAMRARVRETARALREQIEAAQAL